MILFSIICLVLLLITLTNLINWIWRSLDFEGDDIGASIVFGIVASFIYLFMVISIVKTIIKWGQPLINT